MHPPASCGYWLGVGRAGRLKSPMPNLVFPIVFGFLGLIVGSFLAVLTVRIPRDEDFVVRSSHCMSCERTLTPLEMIPVFSWLLQRGRCRGCGAAISTRYILIEIAAAAIGVWAALVGTTWFEVGASALLGWQLLVIAVVDAEHFWLPDILTLPLAATGLATAALTVHGLPWPQVAGLVVGFGFLWLISRVYKLVRGREGLGGGDPIMFAAAGAWVGWTGLPYTLLIACVAGLSVVAAKLLLRKAVRSDDRLPFGTFLAIGAWLTWQLAL